MTTRVHRDHNERNPLVLTGQYERVFVSELEAGDVNAFGDVIAGVDRPSWGGVVINHERGFQTYYRDPASTILVRTKR